MAITDLEASKLLVTLSQLKDLKDDLLDLIPEQINSKLNNSPAIQQAVQKAMKDIELTETTINSIKGDLMASIEDIYATQAQLQLSAQNIMSDLEADIATLNNTTNQKFEQYDRNSEETYSTYFDPENGQLSKIQQTANKVQSLLYDGPDSGDTTSYYSALVQTAKDLTAEVFETNENGKVSKMAQLKTVADQISSVVYDANIGCSAIKQRVDSISSIVYDGGEDRISKIEQTATEIKLAVADMSADKVAAIVMDSDQIKSVVSNSQAATARFQKADAIYDLVYEKDANGNPTGNLSQWVQNAQGFSSTVQSKGSTGNALVSYINQSSEKIEMKALNIDLTGYVTFNSLKTEGKTTINGSNITTGIIKSTNYTENGGVCSAGTKIDLSNGIIKSKNFNITNGGDVIINGKVTADTGKIGGWIISNSMLKRQINVTGSDTYTNGTYYIGLSGNTTTSDDGDSIDASSPIIKIVKGGTDTRFGVMADGTVSCRAHFHSAGIDLWPNPHGETSVKHGGYIDFHYGITSPDAVAGKDTYYGTTTKITEGDLDYTLRLSEVPGQKGVLSVSTHNSDNQITLALIQSAGEYTSSDRRLKSEIADLSLEDSLNILTNLSSKTYILHSSQNVKKIGFIAQDVKEIENTDNELMTRLVNYDEYMDLYSLDYNGFIPILTTGWQYHETEINSLKARIKELEEEIALLKS